MNQQDNKNLQNTNKPERISAAEAIARIQKRCEELGIPTTEMDYSKNKKTASIHFMNKPKKG